MTRIHIWVYYPFRVEGEQHSHTYHDPRPPKEQPAKPILIHYISHPLVGGKGRAVLKNRRNSYDPNVRNLYHKLLTHSGKFTVECYKHSITVGDPVKHTRPNGEVTTIRRVTVPVGDGRQQEIGHIATLSDGSKVTYNPNHLWSGFTIRHLINQMETLALTIDEDRYFDWEPLSEGAEPDGSKAVKLSQNGSSHFVSKVITPPAWIRPEESLFARFGHLSQYWEAA